MPRDGDAFPAFEGLCCEQLSFAFRNEKGEPSFSLEPLHFSLNKGELVFITGGNRSGKSTFLRVSAALYPPTGGEILVNGTVVRRQNRQAYRDLFSAVFADYHLFDRLYGIKDPDAAKFNALLDLMEIDGKTSLEADGKIATTRLSTGQRKRLALVMALMEERPILLLDEWAAEQDPVFRRKFYREMLPALKAQGKTIIAVTHDDEFYDVADRVLKMQYGKFLPG